MAGVAAFSAEAARGNIPSSYSQPQGAASREATARGAGRVLGETPRPRLPGGAVVAGGQGPQEARETGMQSSIINR